MRRGLMKWREDELSSAELAERVLGLQTALERQGLDGLIIYTTLVRPAAVHYLTGFTPYWSDGLLLLPRKGRPTFVTALSRRVGQWLASANPTCEIQHSPRPGLAIGEKLKEMGLARVGAVELDMIPGTHIDDLSSVSSTSLSDATSLFTSVRATPTRAEIQLACHADRIALQAFREVDLTATEVGDITGPLERVVRIAGAEECYIAIAPDLSVDTRLARQSGDTPLGEVFAARISVAYNGVWTRRTETYSRNPTLQDEIQTVNSWVEDLAADLELNSSLDEQISSSAKSLGLSLEGWHLEGPVATRPLKRLTDGHGAVTPAPYGVLGISARHGSLPTLVSRLLIPQAAARLRDAA